ncbi:MAG: hypothetical protein M3044_22770 [Thermoproteota archaeon]|nr:hypothetical protein [Thermoproteota archaeon]
MLKSPNQRSTNPKNILITIIILVAGRIAGNFDSLVKGDDPIFVKQLDSTWLGLVFFVVIVV